MRGRDIFGMIESFPEIVGSVLQLIQAVFLFVRQQRELFLRKGLSKGSTLVPVSLQIGVVVLPRLKELLVLLQRGLVVPVLVELVSHIQVPELSQLRRQPPQVVLEDPVIQRHCPFLQLQDLAIHLLIMDTPHVTSLPEEKQLARRIIRVTLFAILSTLTVNTLISGALFKESLNTIISLQAGATPASIFFFNIVSILADTVGVTFVIGTLFMVHRKRFGSLVFLSFFLLNTYFMTILKAIYHEARPFWYSKSIQQLQWTCPREYGNPSGHSWMVIVLYEPLFTDFLVSDQMTVKAALWGYQLALFALVPFSRVYLGAHSGNQVFFGFLMGSAMVVLYRFGLEAQFYRLYHYILDKSWQPKKHLTLVKILCVHFVFVVVPPLIYGFAPTEDFEYIQILNNKCPHRITTSIGLNGGILMTSILISLVFGMVYGLLYSPPGTSLYIHGKWKYHPRLPKLYAVSLRMGVEVVLIGVPGLFVLLLGISDLEIHVKYLISSVLMSVAGYTLMCYSHSLLVKWKIVTAPSHLPESLL